MSAKKTTAPKSDDFESLSELELSLTILWNSVKRWMNQRSKEGELNGLSDLDVFLMHLLVYRDRQLRANDLAFALSIDDMHLVSYSLKKLVRIEAISSTKIGKEVFYKADEKAKRHYREFLDALKRGHAEREALHDVFGEMGGVTCGG